MTLSDDALTETGFSTPHSGRVLLLACGALAREILALIELNRWMHLTLKCLPAKLHLYPDKITREVEKAIKANLSHYDKIYVVYADCGTGGQLQKLCESYDIDMIEGPHCYSFFEGNEAFQTTNDPLGTFYLTDFLVRQFDAFIWKPMGLDRHPELKDMLFGHYEKLVYQAQTDDAALDRLAKSHAERLGLSYEKRLTGYGDLTGFLQKAAVRDAPHST